MDAKIVSAPIQLGFFVSIHAPVMDAKPYLSISTGIAACFNPRARDGRETDVLCVTINSKVSIHAPVMDANQKIKSSAKNYVFQSTRP